MQRIDGKSPISRTVYGNKAANTDILLRNCLPALPAVAISADETLDPVQIKEELQCLLGAEHDTVEYIVRSSGLNEDGDHGSLAGHFISVPNCRTVTDIIHAVQAIRDSGDHVPCFIQPMVVPLVSGVTATTNPLTYRKELVTEYTTGHLSGIVSGTKVGNIIRHSSQQTIAPEFSTQIETVVDQIVSVWASPVEIEWAIDKQQQFVVLQVRPIVLPKVGTYSPLDRRLPSVVSSHSKIVFRKRMHSTGMRTGDAYVVLLTSDSWDAGWEVPDLDGAAVSVVLLYPERLQGRVERCFVSIAGTNADFYIGECARYAIRRYPEADQTDKAIRQVASRGLEEFDVVAVLAQVVLDAKWTGIATMIGDHLIVELAQGHFVPKGIVSTSQYVFTRSGSLLTANRVKQSLAYHFCDGHVIEETLEYNVFPSHDQLARIATSLLKVTNLSATAIEFGVIAEADSENCQVYAIDELDSDETASLDVQDISRSVISNGTGGGKVVKVLSEDTRMNMDRHARDIFFDDTGSFSEPVTVVAATASTSLLPVIRSLSPGSAIVFNTCSLLAHVPVVLRELGIPAIRLNDEEFQTVQKANSVHIDTLNTPLFSVL